MMHAKIIEDTGKLGKQEPSQEPTRRLERLSSDDREYYHRRSNQEAEAARIASCCEARLAHEELAEAYRLLCGSGKCQDAPQLSAMLPTFLFKPHPPT